MKPLVHPLLTVLSVAALTVSLAGCGTRVEAGRVVQAEGDRLTMTDKHTEDQKTFELAADTEITVNGQPATIDQIQPGDSVTVKTQEQDGRRLAVKVEANSEAAPGTPPQGPTTTPEPTDRGFTPSPETVPDADHSQDQPPFADATVYRGELMRAGDGQIVFKTRDGQEHKLTVNPDSSITFDGKAIELSDLPSGARVTVTTRGTGQDAVVVTIKSHTPTEGGQPEGNEVNPAPSQPNAQEGPR